VGFTWSWLKFLSDSVVNYLGGRDNASNGTAHSIRETSDESSDDLREDHGDVLRAQIGVCQEVEMSLQSLGERGSTTAWWSHS